MQNAKTTDKGDNHTDMKRNPRSADGNAEMVPNIILATMHKHVGMHTQRIPKEILEGMLKGMLTWILNILPDMILKGIITDGVLKANDAANSAM